MSNYKECDKISTEFINLLQERGQLAGSSSFEPLLAGYSYTTGYLNGLLSTLMEASPENFKMVKDRLDALKEQN